MTTTNVNEIKFKDGSSWPAGASIVLSVNRDKPTVTEAYNKATRETRKLMSIRLHRYFDEFLPVSMDELEIAMMDGICDSLTGEQVEPDGWDRQGFPSMLLAAGLM